MLYSDLSGVYVICLHMSMVFICWLVVSNMNFIFHFIYGMSSFPLTNIFQDFITPPTSYGFYGSLGSVRPVRSGRLVPLAQPSRATQQPSHQSNPGTSRKSQAATKASSSSSPRRSPAAAEATNQHLQRYCLHSFLGPGLPTFAIWSPAPPPGAAGPIVLRLRHRPKHWQ